MHYKTNRLNHDFQIAYFLAGSCQTADAAYALLNDLKEDRSNAIKMFEAHKLREQAKIGRAQRILASDTADEFEKLEAQADLSEIGAMSETTRNNYNAAVAELEFIEKCQAALLPFRKYAHLPDPIAHEAAQQEEWKLQLVHTAESFMLSGGAIPHDHWSTMRMHPEFSTGILPAIEKTKQLMNEANQGISGQTQQERDAALARRNAAALELTAHLERRAFKLPELPKQLTTEQVEQQKLAAPDTAKLDG